MGIRYEFDRTQMPIGEGGMGTVYKGLLIDVRNGFSREIAIKEIKEKGEPAMSAIIQRARREASIRLHNDNLVEMISFLETEENFLLMKKVRYYVVSELLHGVSLDKVLKGEDMTDFDGNVVPFAVELHHRYLSDREGTACYIIKRVLAGIMALHDAGYVHRDIDPSNIMVTSDGKIKLIDFGIAKKKENVSSSDKALTSDGTFIGKAEYAAPELVLGDVASQDYTTDIYAIGILFFLLLTGELPFNGARHEILYAQRFTKPPLKKITNSKYRAIVGKAMEKIQSRRYANTAQFRAALDGPEPVSYRKIAVVCSIVAAVFCMVFLGIRYWPEPKTYPDPDSGSVIINPEQTEELNSDSKIDVPHLLRTMKLFREEKGSSLKNELASVRKSEYPFLYPFCAAVYVVRFGESNLPPEDSDKVNGIFSNEKGNYLNTEKVSDFRKAYVLVCYSLRLLRDMGEIPQVKEDIILYADELYKKAPGDLKAYPGQSL